jgi:hypothetical protein
MEQTKRGRKPATDKQETSQVLTQAQRIIDRFGGIAKLRDALAAVGKPRDISSVYRWTQPQGRHGTGGIIPTSAWPDILLAARKAGIVITEDLYDLRYLMPELKRD